MEEPAVPQPATESIPLATPPAAGPGSSAAAKVEADLVGVKWSGDPAAEFRVEVKRSPHGEWEDAGELERFEELPDDGSPDAAAARARQAQSVSDPLWVDDVEAVRVTVVKGSVDDLTLEAVTAEAPKAPSGSAGALGVGLPAGPDRFAYAIALVIAGAALVAVAAGWSPWRSRRQLALVVAAVAVTLAACAPAPPPPPPEPPASPTVAAPPQPAIIMRSQWGPDLAWNPSPDCAPGPTIASGLKFAVVHHTVNSNTYGPGDSQAMVRAIWQYHVGTRGYCDIAYNFIVDRFGQIFEGRMGGIDRAVVAAHTGGFNTGSTGIAYLGTLTSEQPPQAAWDALVGLLAWKLSVHRVDPSLGFTTTSNGGGSRWPAGTVVSFPTAIVGHRDLWPTACPGDAFWPRLGELRAAVQPRIAWSDPTTTTTSTTLPAP